MNKSLEVFIILLLAVIFLSIWYFLKTKFENYLENEPTVVTLRNKIIPFFPELTRVKLMKGNSSYTINKQKIYLCTESKGEIYEDNMLVYVILHELAHTQCSEIGHGSKFQNIFKSFLERAERHNLFNPFLPRTENYCKL
jgi:predicted metal-dependent hydrolase